MISLVYHLAESTKKTTVLVVSCLRIFPAVSESLAAGFEGGVDGARFVAAFEDLAFVVLLLAFADGNPQLKKAPLGQQLHGHDGSSLLFSLDQGIDFAPFGK